ncbi:MAG: hypothetical protein MHM6MM_005962 [Cercozoa sp. M6MM]
MAGKTEWEDVLIKHGIMEAPEVLPTQDELENEAREELAEAAREHMEQMSLKTLNELEDDLEENTLERLRRKRLQEMKEAAKRNKYGKLTEILRDEYETEVKDASADGEWVVCLLYQPQQRESDLMTQCLGELARRRPAFKFVRIVAQQAIDDYPRELCPTLVVYHDGTVVGNLKGVQRFGGLRMTADVLEYDFSLPPLQMWPRPFERDPRELISRQFRMKRVAADDLRLGSDSDSDWLSSDDSPDDGSDVSD